MLCIGSVRSNNRSEKIEELIGCGFKVSRHNYHGARMYKAICPITPDAPRPGFDGEYKVLITISTP